MAISIAGLNKLVRGELLVPHKEQPGRFSEKVVADVLAQDPKRISFGGAVARRVLGLYDDFGTYYPNLLPALSAMVRTGGSDGSDIAVSASENMLSAAIQGKDPLDSSEYLAAGASAYKFSIIHPYARNEKTHEVWCPGEAVAKSIIRESGRAALTLAAIPDITAAYGTPLLDPYDDDRIGIRDKIENRVLSLYSAKL